MSSEALEAIRRRNAAAVSGPWDTSRGTLSDYITQSRLDVLALLAEVARLEQERDEWKGAAECVPTSWADIYGREHELREAAEAALAVAREREQRAEKLHKAASDFVATTTVFRLRKESRDEFARLAAALVDEPAAAETLHIDGCTLAGDHGGDCWPAAADEPGETPCP